jgi:AcrR family transcriptional regulator
VPAVDVNGHAARARRTRSAIVDALVELLREGTSSPSASEIAARAGVSKRSIFVHYATLDDLHRDVAARATDMVLELLWVIDPRLPLEERIEAICRQRAEVHESIGPLRRAAAARAATSEVMAESQRFSQRSSRDQITRVFATELRTSGRTERRRVVASIDAVLAGPTWDLWRGPYRLDVGECRATMQTVLRALLDRPADVADYSDPAAPHR